MTIADSYKLLNIKRAPSQKQEAFWILGFRKFQIPIPNTNKVIVFYSVLLIPDLQMLSFFLDSKQVQGCGMVFMLIVLQVITFTVWVNLFLMVASLYCAPFSLVLFLVVCVLMERVSHLGKESSFSGIKVSTQLSVLTFTLEELSSICLYLDKVSSKNCENANCVMIAVFAKQMKE